MNDTELKKLNDFCAIKVMGFSRGKEAKLSASEGRTFYHDGVIHQWLDDFGLKTSWFSPTTDPTAAMQVLQKCISNLGWSRIVSFGQTSDGNYFMNHSDSDPSSESFCNVESETISLAIALFAKQLFSK